MVAEPRFRNHGEDATGQRSSKRWVAKGSQWVTKKTDDDQYSRRGAEHFKMHGHHDDSEDEKPVSPNLESKVEHIALQIGIVHTHHTTVQRRQ